MSSHPYRALSLVLALAASAALAACAPGGADAPLEERILGQWGDDGGSSPWLRFDADGTLTGSDGCNRMGGSWKVEDGRVQTPGVFSTKMWCEDYAEWLGDLASLEVDGDELIVFDADRERLGTLSRS